jgi:hypothetical protein
MSRDLREEVARAIYMALYGDKGGRWECVEERLQDVVWGNIADAALTAARPVIEAETREAVANRLEGAGDLIPLLACFATFVSGNKQPCMSGDPRDRLHPHQRRWFDDAMREVAAAIRSQP